MSCVMERDVMRHGAVASWAYGFLVLTRTGAIAAVRLLAGGVL